MPVEESVLSNIGNKILESTTDDSSIHLGKLIESYMCIQCNKVMADERKLKNHMYQCKKEKPLVCNICSKAF